MSSGAPTSSYRNEVKVLPVGHLLDQTEVQKTLGLVAQHEGLEAALDELESWLTSVGYFEHLNESNIFLTFHAREGLPPLKLQVNYSRLSYRLPEGPRSQSCPLCIENIGSPGKEKLRVLELELAGTPYFAHPTPFPLHAGHFVLNLRRHEPMRVNQASLMEAVDFLRQAPSWLVASNSDVAWAGASVLGHHHFQIFRSLHLPVEEAHPLAIGHEGGVELQLLYWPAPVVRLCGPIHEVLVYAGGLIDRWRRIDRNCTFNYLLRRKHEQLVAHMIFRHPAYVSSPRLKNYKSEGVGVIEMAGEAIVPPRPGLSRAENENFFRNYGWQIALCIIAQNSPPLCHPDGVWSIPELLGLPLELCDHPGKEVSCDERLPVAQL